MAVVSLPVICARCGGLGEHVEIKHCFEALRAEMYRVCQQPRIPEMVNITQACALVGVCRRTMYSWMELGKVQVVRTPRGTPRIVTASLGVKETNE